MGEPEGFVEVDRCGQSCTAAEEDAVCADSTRFFNGRDDDPAADALVAQLGHYRHLPEFEHPREPGDKSDAADDHSVEAGKEYAATAVDDLDSWVIEDAAVFVFEAEEAGDPFLVQRLKGPSVLGTVQGGDDEFGLRKGAVCHDSSLLAKIDYVQ